jgi:UDP-N-acetylglucosamine pyrophosphorylase
MLKLNRKYHIAEKKINLYDSVNQVVVKPTKNTGIKFELFCFDCFDITDKFALFEVLR